MRVVRFVHNDQECYGSVDGNNILLWSDAPWKGGEKRDVVVDVESVRLCAPCKPGKVIATAINFPGATGLTEKNNEPLVFVKPSTSIIGDGDTIISPFNDADVWGECELGIVIGKPLKNATVEEAIQAVYGYTVANDVSCNNILDWDHHLARSKGADTFCVLGPWIDTEFEPKGKCIRGYHNDILLRKGYCHERLWHEPDLLVWLSSWITLEVGDVILTGAPSRVRSRLYLESGDHFTCHIDGLGKISNPFVKAFE